MLGLAARSAIPVNMSVSLVTVAASLLFRTTTSGITVGESLHTAILGLVTGGILGAPAGVALISRLDNRQLDRALGGVLALIGGLLLLEGGLGLETATSVTGDIPRLVTGVFLGIGIGTVATLLGVAGGELLIPTFVLVFGAGIKEAGTASLMVSLPTLVVGLMRHGVKGWRPGSAGSSIIVPMGIGSVLGSLAGAALVRYSPIGLLKILLGVILIVSAWKTFAHSVAEVGKNPSGTTTGTEAQ